MTRDEIIQWLDQKTQEHAAKYRVRKRRLRKVLHSSDLTFLLTMHLLGVQLKQNRVARGWSPQQLAMRSKVPMRMILRLERGKHIGMTIELLTRLARALGCALDISLTSTVKSVERLNEPVTDESLYVPSYNEEYRHDRTRSQSPN